MKKRAPTSLCIIHVTLLGTQPYDIFICEIDDDVVLFGQYCSFL